MAHLTPESITVQGRDYTRTVWFVAGPKHTPHALGVFLDGEYYLEKVDAFAVLEKAIADGRVPPLSCVFIPSNGPLSRHEDFTCNDRYARFVAEDVISWAQCQLASIRREGNLVCGLSLSGLQAAHITLKYPDVFSSALSQSGSFWWEDCRFASLARNHREIRSRHWLSVGDEETQEGVSHPPTGMHQRVSQINGCQSAVDALRVGGAEVRLHVFHGGHAFDPWRDELGEALRWLTGSEPGCETGGFRKRDIQ